MQKGLFNSLFVLIMLALSSSTIIVNESSQDMLDNFNYIDQLALASDQAVADAVFEETVSASCALSTQTMYENTTQRYISNIISDTSEVYSSISCGIEDINSTLDGDDFFGSINLECRDNSSTVSMDIIKQLQFSKNIDINSVAGCQVTIRDNYDSDNVQVDINR